MTHDNFDPETASSIKELLYDFGDEKPVVYELSEEEKASMES
jgi:hypothetical protein